MQLDYMRERHGIACFHACRVFTAALRLRFEARERREQDLVGLSPFEADKLMRLFYKLWKARPNIGKRAGEFLGHLPAEPDYNDKHGHRVAFPLSSITADPAVAYRPVLDQIAKYDESGHEPARMARFTRDDDGFQVIVPLTTPTELSRLVQKGVLEVSDIAFVQAFGRSTESLSIDEIIAVGRHERAEPTERSVLWELKRWSEWFDAAIVNLELLDAGGDTASLFETSICVWESWSFGLECIKKAGVEDCGFVSDQAYYRDGMLRLARMSDPSLTSLLNVQDAHEVIWGDIRIRGRRTAAFAAWTLATYLGGCVRSLDYFGPYKIGRAFKSVSVDDVERARVMLLRLFDVTELDTPFPGVSTHPLTSALTLPLVSQVQAGEISLGRLAAIVRVVWSKISGTLIQPHVRGLI